MTNTSIFSHTFFTIMPKASKKFKKLKKNINVISEEIETKIDNKKIENEIDNLIF